MMPTLMDILDSFFDLWIIILLVILLRLLKINTKPISISDPKKELLPLIFVIIFYFLWNFFLFAVLYDRLVTIWLDHFVMTDITDVIFPFLWICLAEIIPLTMIIVVLKITNRDKRSIGAEGKDTFRVLALGVIIGIVVIIVDGINAIISGASLTAHHAWTIVSIPYYFIAGFTEELVVRGYIQTRLVANLGTLPGLTLTSLLFALSHFPVIYFNWGWGSALESLVRSLLYIPIGFVFGYIYHKSQSLYPVGIVHWMYNWGQDLWTYR
jgi:membrane protease YdiL (CAAX protease family)